jgi:hypothetical protein
MVVICEREIGLIAIPIFVLVLDDHHNHVNKLVCQVYDHRFIRIYIKRSNPKNQKAQTVRASYADHTQYLN